MDAHRLGPPPGLGQSRGDGSNNNKNNCAAILPQPPPPPPLHLGPLTPAHRPALEAHHAALFPVDYEPAFYDAVMTNTDGVFSFGLFAGGEGGAPTSQPSPALAGFVTPGPFPGRSWRATTCACWSWPSRPASRPGMAGAGLTPRAAAAVAALLLRRPSQRSMS